MLTIAIALSITLQEPTTTDRIADNFTKLQEAWKALTECRTTKPKGLTDDVLRALGKLSNAIEAAGGFGADAGYELVALKRLCVTRANELFARAESGRVRMVVVGGGLVQREEGSSDAMSRFEKAIAKLADLKAKGHDDDDNVQEALVEARKSLKELGLIADEQPQWQRRRTLAVVRALIAGEAFPARAQATPDQEKRIQELILQLGDADMEKRDAAAGELDKIGEPIVPFLKKAMQDADPEVKERAKKLLGVGVKLPEPVAAAPNREQRLFEAVIELEKLEGEKK
jgi:hypothetical protein